jgi:60 kDa SS-A/Ro ribonucleoprotein
LRICKTPTLLFSFIEFYQTINKKLFGTKSWNRFIKRSVAEWYNSKSLKDLLYLTTKYQNRIGWSHRDVLRLAHVKPITDNHMFVYKYLTQKDNNVDIITFDFPIAFDYIRDLKTLHKTESLHDVLFLINKHNYVREHIPTKWLSEIMIWEYLLPHMPIIALLRNLNKMTQVGLFDIKSNLDILESKIENASVHPLQMLISLKMYSKGEGDKGNLTWTPNQKIVGMLDKAFYNLFKSVKKTGKRFLLALDVSSSMTWGSVCGIDCLNAAEVACAMAMITDASEDHVDIMGFSNTFKTLNVSSTRRLDDNLTSTRGMTFGSTDISLPFSYSLENKKKYDCIIVYTDNETNTNSRPPVEVFREYKTQMNLPNTKLIVCATSANKFSIADPNDSSMLDICGFDASVPDVMYEFITNL